MRYLHSEGSLNGGKLAALRRLPTDVIQSSLEQAGALKTRPDGTVLDGHHRLTILAERGVDIDQLPREIMERENQ